MVKVCVYLDTGNVFEYDVESEFKAREHAHAIALTGYRSASVDDPRELTWWPPHRVSKIKLILDEDTETAYFDKPRAT